MFAFFSLSFVIKTANEIILKCVQNMLIFPVKYAASMQAQLGSRVRVRICVKMLKGAIKETQSFFGFGGGLFVCVTKTFGGAQ